MISGSKPSLVSIIVPCYNQAQYLSETLQSILDHTYSNWECIIVNDGSPDNTEEIALEWVRKDNRFKYISKENGGVSSARNDGIKQSSGKYILPLDADDLIEKTYLEKAVRILDDHADIGIVYCKASYFGDKSGNWKIPSHSLKQSLFFNTIFCTALFRRSDFDLTNGYNANMIHGYEDWDFWLYLLELGVRVSKIPENLFFYRIRANSRNSSIDWERLIILYNQIILNHNELYKKHFKDPFIIVDYLKFRKGFTGNINKDIRYLLENFRFSIGCFYMEYKLRTFSRS